MSWLLTALLLTSAPSPARDTADTGARDCDLDDDGFDALFCGGEDCNDGDASVYPGAEDPREDGLDQDCDGRDVLGGEDPVLLAGGAGVCGHVPGHTSPLALLGLIALAARRKPCVS